jgi:hypothetical protein
LQQPQSSAVASIVQGAQQFCVKVGDAGFKLLVMRDDLDRAETLSFAVLRAIASTPGPWRSDALAVSLKLQVPGDAHDTLSMLAQAYRAHVC